MLLFSNRPPLGGKKKKKSLDNPGLHLRALITLVVNAYHHMHIIMPEQIYFIFIY